MAVFNVAGYLIEAQMACNYCFPNGTIIFQINSEFWKEGIFRWENRTSCLVGLKTHPTIVPRSGIELTTSRLHSFIVARVSHALNHSAMDCNSIFILAGSTSTCTLHRVLDAGANAQCGSYVSVMQHRRSQSAVRKTRPQLMPPYVAEWDRLGILQTI